MEPERKIEKLLRVYARKRRTAAGEPLKLHPATRRLLQDEVSRQSTKPEAEEVSITLWQLLRQRWVFLVGFALVIFLGATLFLPELNNAKHEEQSFTSLNNLKQIGAAVQMVAGKNNGKLPASLDLLTNESVPQQTLTDPVSGKPFVYVAGGEILDDLQSNDVLAYSPMDKDGRAVLLADGRVEYMSRARFSELTNHKSFQLALADNSVSERPAKRNVNAPMAAAAPPPVPVVGGEFKEEKPGTVASRWFVQTDTVSNQQNLYRNASASAQTMPVLQLFQVLQNGDVISVVDRDGSIYQGSIQVATAAAVAAERKEPAPMMPSGSVAAPTLGQANETQSIANAQQAAQNYFFRVAGMNRTLKQNVVFSGNVEAIPGAATNTQQTFGLSGGGGGGVAQYNLQVSTNQQQELLLNSRIVGTAVIDRTNRIEINAVPTMH